MNCQTTIIQEPTLSVNAHMKDFQAKNAEYNNDKDGNAETITSFFFQRKSKQKQLTWLK